MHVVAATPAAPAVTWEEAKAHLRLDGEQEKVFVEGLITAATQHVGGPDGWLGRSIGVQDLEVRMGLPVSASIRLPLPPVLSLISIAYVDQEDNEHTIDASSLNVFDGEIERPTSGWPWLNGSQRRDALRIQYQAGYETVPAPIKAAILMMVGDMHRFRSSASDLNITPTAIPMSATVDDLLQPYRVYR